MLNVYEECARNVLAMPVVRGRKSKIESFAGANVTYTIEAMMRDKKALQVSQIYNSKSLGPKCSFTTVSDMFLYVSEGDTVLTVG